MKPQVLQLNPILIPSVNDKLAARYTVHKYFETAGQEAWLREHGASIDAAITGGHTGISRAMLEPRLSVVSGADVKSNGNGSHHRSGIQFYAGAPVATPEGCSMREICSE